MPVQRGSDQPGRRRRSESAAGGPEPRWVPVASLAPLARALLSDDLGGRAEVPRHVAQRVTDEADRWSAYGFSTADAVRAWSDVPPAAAAYLAERRVPPEVLDLPTTVGRASVPLKLAIATGVLPVERAYELLVATGEHRPEASNGSAVPTIPSVPPDPIPVDASLAASTPNWSGPVDDQPARRAASSRPVAPVVFSHDVNRRSQPADEWAERPTATDGRRRSADRSGRNRSR
ncbi:hypothetical protein [Plantactinospora sp. GCM10030261]|uniref:hypothetical protein n=1 Tax=Plantactinospora sp. GCM10030261 TaxID=3273420 RepID=UPI003623896E